MSFFFLVSPPIPSLRAQPFNSIYNVITSFSHVWNRQAAAQQNVLFTALAKDSIIPKFGIDSLTKWLELLQFFNIILFMYFIGSNFTTESIYVKVKFYNLMHVSYLSGCYFRYVKSTHSSVNVET